MGMKFYFVSVLNSEPKTYEVLYSILQVYGQELLNLHAEIFSCFFQRTLYEKETAQISQQVDLKAPDCNLITKNSKLRFKDLNHFSYTVQCFSLLITRRYDQMRAPVRNISLMD